MSFLDISEYRAVQRPSHSVPILSGTEPALAAQQLAVGAASAQSAEFQATTQLIRVQANVACRIAIGVNPVATAASARLAPGVTEYFNVSPGSRLAVIASVEIGNGNIDTAALVTHVAAAAGAASSDQANLNGRGAQIGVNITAGAGTSPTLQVIVEGKDAASGAYYPIFTSAALAAVAGFTLLSVYPGLTGSATVGNQVLPKTWRVRTVIGGTAPSVSATVGASVIR